MTIAKPNLGDVKDIAERFNLALEGDELEEYWRVVCQALDSYQELDTLADAKLPVRYPRNEVGYRPHGENNPGNGWSWKCRIEGASEGILKGKTVAVKDNVCLAGIPMLNGSPVMEGFVPDEDATIVTRLLDAGATIIGKTNVPGFCLDGGGVTGYPEPQPVNPHDANRLPGASSSGSAVVVASGEADLAIGGDQGGSIRLPASWSGCCGIKPTYGLVPYTGIFPIEMTLDHTGPMARTVEDCAKTLSAIAGVDGLDPRQGQSEAVDYLETLRVGPKRLRIGLLKEAFNIKGISERAVDDAVRNAAERLKGAGAVVSEVSVPLHRIALSLWNAIAFEGATAQMIEGDGFGVNWKGHYSTGLIDFYGRGRRARGRDFPPTAKVTILAGKYMSEAYNHHYYAKAQNLSRRLKAQYDTILRDVDVIVMPTTPMVARIRPTGKSLSEIFGSALSNLQNTAAFDITGHPAMSVPCGSTDGLPIGLMLVGREFDERMVLRAAQSWEDLQ